MQWDSKKKKIVVADLEPKGCQDPFNNPMLLQAIRPHWDCT